MGFFDPFDYSKTIRAMFPSSNIDHLYVFNYMVDVLFMDRLLKSFKIANTHIIAQKVDFVSGYTYIKPNLPFAYGTHHTKMFICFCANSCHVVIHTANIIPRDWKFKTQGYHVFKGTLGSKSSNFKTDLIDYIDGYRNLNELSQLLSLFEFDSNLSLVPSIPGKFIDKRYGLNRIKDLMCTHRFDTLIVQVSSIPKMGFTFQKSPIFALMQAFNCATVKLIYPSKDAICDSYEGIDAGNSFPHAPQNYQIHKNWLMPCLHHWKTKDPILNQCMPHIKTFAVEIDGIIEYTLQSSHNISNAAWGSINKQGELFIKSYELGVLEIGDHVPYALPLTKYEDKDEMWVSGSN